MGPLFENFKVQFKRTYESQAEEAKRFANFRVNLRHAADMGAKNPLATFGMNGFSDMSPAEFKSFHSAEEYFKKHLPKRNITSTIHLTESELKAIENQFGSSVDWRTKGAVTPVKNQAGCEGCWAFSTTGNIEGQWFIAHGILNSLSEQNLLSCDTNDHGCHGGLMDQAFQWVVDSQQGKIYTERSYPFVSASGNNPSCDNSKTHEVGAIISGYQDIPQDERQMSAWLAKNGPISVGVDASAWQTYTGGIMTDCIVPDETPHMDHGVLIVGYGTSGNTPYWIIKNSWTTNWGEAGYIRIERFKNTCLITGYPTTSTVARNGPQPPTASPSPSDATFGQKVCPDSKCISADCEVHNFPQNQCLQVENGGSLMARCTPSAFKQNYYYSSTNCTGPSTPSSVPLNQCLRASRGFFEMICHSSLALGRVSDKKVFVGK